MSHLPPPAGPLPYATFVPPPPDPRPASVRAVAIVGIILAVLGLFGGICSIPQYLGLDFSHNPVIEAIRRDRLLQGFTIGSLAVGMILALVLLWAARGLLSLKREARTLIMRYAVIYLIISLTGVVLNFTIINPRMQKVTQEAINSTPMLNTPVMKTTMQYSMYGGMAFGIILLAWPIWILYVMTRPHVKAAFERGMPGRPV